MRGCNVRKIGKTIYKTTDHQSHTVRLFIGALFGLRLRATICSIVFTPTNLRQRSHACRNWTGRHHFRGNKALMRHALLPHRRRFRAEAHDRIGIAGHHSLTLERGRGRLRHRQDIVLPAALGLHLNHLRLRGFKSLSNIEVLHCTVSFRDGSGAASRRRTQVNSVKEKNPASSHCESFLRPPPCCEPLLASFVQNTDELRHFRIRR
jgi:hypothetical protein